MERHPVYVIHPWGHTEKEWKRNAKIVKEYMNKIWQMGFNPVYAPFFNSHVDGTWAEYIEADKLLLDKIDKAVVCGSRLSKGCIVEIRHCIYRGIPITFLEDVMATTSDMNYWTINKWTALYMEREVD